MISANQAHMPITESDEELAALVGDLSALLLALSIVHMSGDMSIIRAGIKTAPPTFNGDTWGSISEADTARIRGEALQVIKAWRDAGLPLDKA